MTPLPDTMTAIAITEFGPAEVLKPTQRPLPTLLEGEVLIAVEAAGVNRPDVIQRLGHYAPPHGVTDIPGLEVAGRVVATAGDCGRWSAGDRVCALVAGGGYAEYCVAPAPQCLPIPGDLGPIEAAALPETVFTVWTTVFERGQLASGESLLLHGGTSGIGTMAIQMARLRGARVIATAGSTEKCLACLDLGAERAVNYRTEDFVTAALAFTAGKGVDVVLDMVGGDYLSRNLRCLAEDGRHVSIAFLNGAKAEINIEPVMRKRLTLTGSTLRPRPVGVKAAIARSVEAEIWPLITSGRLKPVINATFPLAQADQAHRLMESSRHIGKIVLKLAHKTP